MEQKVYQTLNCSPNRVAATLAKVKDKVERMRLYILWINEPGYVVQDFMP